MPPFTKGLDVSVDVTIDIVVDLTKIAVPAFAYWLWSKTSRSSPNRRVDMNIDGKHIPENEADAVKLIAREIQNNANDDAEND